MKKTILTLVVFTLTIAGFTTLSLAGATFEGGYITGSASEEIDTPNIDTTRSYKGIYTPVKEKVFVPREKVVKEPTVVIRPIVREVPTVAQTEFTMVKATAETAMEVSKKAEKTAQSALQASREAKASADKALEAANKAIEASNKAAGTINRAIDRLNALAAEMEKSKEVKEVKEVSTYTVKKGDCLSRIAAQKLGSGRLWRKIYQANKNKIKDPNLIYPGQVLLIP